MTSANSGSSSREKFQAAVRIITSLPKEGSFKPSNEMLLRFYSLYKQATIGPCRQPRPGFWDLVNRAKWDAWNSLGNMESETAMLEYVEELKKVIETMPHTPEVEKFLDTLGSFYEVVQDDKDDDHAAPASTAAAVAVSASAALGLDDVGGATFPIDGRVESDGELSSSDDESPTSEASSASANGNDGEARKAGPAATAPDRLHHLQLGEDEELEDDEFCDTIEGSASGGGGVAPGGPVLKVASAAPTATSSPVVANHRSHAKQHAVGAAPATPSGGTELLLRHVRQIRDSLTRLQADVDRVHQRLDALEASTKSSRGDHSTKSSSSIVADGVLGAPASLLRWIFGGGGGRGVSPAALALFLLWPVVLQLLLRLGAPTVWWWLWRVRRRR